MAPQLFQLNATPIRNVVHAREMSAVYEALAKHLRGEHHEKWNADAPIAAAPAPAPQPQVRQGPFGGAAPTPLNPLKPPVKHGDFARRRQKSRHEEAVNSGGLLGGVEGVMTSAHMNSMKAIVVPDGPVGYESNVDVADEPLRTLEVGPLSPDPPTVTLSSPSPESSSPSPPLPPSTARPPFFAPHFGAPGLAGVPRGITYVPITHAQHKMLAQAGLQTPVKALTPLFLPLPPGANGEARVLCPDEHNCKLPPRPINPHLMEKVDGIGPGAKCVVLHVLEPSPSNFGLDRLLVLIMLPARASCRPLLTDCLSPTCPDR